MALVRYALTTANGGLSVPNDGNPHTVLTAVPNLSTRVIRIQRIVITCSGTVPTDPPIQFQFFASSNTGTATGETPAPLTTNAQSVTSTGKTAYTVEPTSPLFFFSGDVHPVLGFTFEFPYGSEYYIAHIVGVTLTNPASASAANVVNVSIYVEE